MNPFVFASLLLPCFDTASVPRIDFREDCIVVHGWEATETEVAAGRIATVVFQVFSADGRELYDAEKRGLPYSFRVGSSDPLLSAAVAGLKPGVWRTVYAMQLSDSRSMIPAGTELKIRLRVLE